MGKHLVLVGGGHAHLTTLLKGNDFIQRGHRVTLIGPAPYHYYSGMGPGMLSGIYRPAEIRFHVQKMAEDRGIAFVRGKVSRVDPKARELYLDSGQTICYDVVSFNTGSYVPGNTMAGRHANVFKVKPIDNLLKARQLILEQLSQKKLRLVVVGGGAAGVELCGNLWRLVQEHNGRANITLLPGRTFLPSVPEKMRRLARKALAQLGIEIFDGTRVDRMEENRVFTDSGRAIPADFVLLAWGVKPSALFADSGLSTGPDGGLLVNRFLQSIDHPEIFGGGDCICFEEKPLDKVGVYAVRQNPILFHNLLAMLQTETMAPFDPGGSYLLIFNLGDGRGILHKNGITWLGKLSFRVKDYIDKKFMKQFQVSGELS